MYVRDAGYSESPLHFDPKAAKRNESRRPMDYGRIARNAQWANDYHQAHPPIQGDVELYSWTAKPMQYSMAEMEHFRMSRRKKEQLEEFSNRMNRQANEIIISRDETRPEIRKIMNYMESNAPDYQRDGFRYGANMLKQSYYVNDDNYDPIRYDSSLMDVFPSMTHNLPVMSEEEYNYLDDLADETRQNGTNRWNSRTFLVAGDRTFPHIHKTRAKYPPH